MDGSTDILCEALRPNWKVLFFTAGVYVWAGFEELIYKTPSSLGEACFKRSSGQSTDRVYAQKHSMEM